MAKFQEVNGTVMFVPSRSHGPAAKAREERATWALWNYRDKSTGRIPAHRLPTAARAASLASGRTFCPARTKRLAEMLHLAPMTRTIH